MNHVVALSGGKDSTALALRLAEIGEHDYKYICTPTGDELPEVTAHLERLEVILGRPIIKLDSGETLTSLITHYQSLPNFRMRWCTRILKIEPCIDYLEKNRPAVVYVGLRADEAKRKGGIYDHIPDIDQRCPLREWRWGIDEVLAYLHKRGIVVPKRTDCARCYHQRLSDWWNLWHDHREIFEDAVNQEKRVSKARGKSCTFRSSDRDTWPVGLELLGAEFAKGRIPVSVDTQLDLFSEKNICRVCSL